MILTTKLTMIAASAMLSSGLVSAPLVASTWHIAANGTTQSVPVVQQGKTVYVPLQTVARLAHATATLNRQTDTITWTNAASSTSSSPSSPSHRASTEVSLSTWPASLVLQNNTPKWTKITSKNPLLLNNGTTVTQGIDSGIMYAVYAVLPNPRVLTQYATYVLNGKYQSLSFSAGIPNAVKNNDGTVTLSIAIGNTSQTMATVKQMSFTSGNLPGSIITIPLDHATLLRVTIRSTEPAYKFGDPGYYFYNSLGIALVNPMLIPYPTH